MAYLIDSDWVIDHLLDLPEAVQRLAALAEQGIAISIITYLEVYQGVLCSSHPEESRRICTRSQVDL
jgi:predicted nucleic acid-binding protein